MQIETPTSEYIQQGYIEKREPLSEFSNIRTRLSEIIENMISPKKELSFDEQINEKFLNLDFGSEFDIDATRIGIADASFFINLLNQENLINYSVQDESLNLSIGDRKLDATHSLINMLKTSYETKKAIRLDFDSDITVVLKLDNKGKIQAHFIPGTSEVESYLKSNIPILKQTFEQENIGYSYLGYSQNRNKKDNKNSKKER